MKMKLELELHTHTERRKLGMNEWMVCTQYLNIIVETAFFTIDACNLILSIFALSEQTYHLKLKVCVRVECVLSIFLSLEIAVKCGNTFKAPLDKSAGTGMVSFSSPFLLRINKIKFLNSK